MQRLILSLVLISLSYIGWAQTQVPVNSTSPIYYQNGKVGMGITNPQAALDITGPITGSSYLSIPTLKVSAGEQSGRVAMWLETINDNATDFVFRNNGVGRVWLSSRNSAAGYCFNIYTNPDGVGGPELVALSIKQDGRIGIGSENPTALFQVSKAIDYNGYQLAARMGNRYNHWTYFGDKNSGRIRGSGEGYLVLESNSQGDSDKNIYMRSAQDHILSTYSNDTWQQRLIVRNDGRVGIGTNPAENTMLDVEGTIRATEIKVEAQTADFVFEPDYELRPLNEIEAFVKENKHLPEIPSAKQMEANGVNVAEMNKLLLQKVEELTLHIIELNKRLKKVESK